MTLWKRPGFKPHLTWSFSLFAAILALVISLPSCSGSSNGSDQRKAEKHVIIAVDTSAESLDPRVGTSLASFRIQQLTHTPLILQGNKGNLEPGLAQSWKREYDPQKDIDVWTFRLRRDVTFHDGSSFSAEDVKYTFESMLHPDFISRKKAAFSQIIKITVPAPDIIVFSLKGSNPALAANMPAVGIIPKKAADNSEKTIVGTGPFRCSNSKNKETLEFEAFAHFYQGKPGINKITVKTVPDDTTRALEIMHGSADLVINDLNITDAAYLKEKPNRSLVQAQGLPYEYLGFNHEHPILKNQKVRQAIALALDRDTIIKNLLGGLARKAESPLIPGLWKVKPDFTPLRRDLEKSMTLLDEAGFTDPDGPGGQPRFVLEMKCSSRKSSRDFATVIRQQLGQVGIEVQIRSLEWQTYYSDIVNGNFSLYALRWVGIINPEFFGAVFHSTSIPGITPPEGSRNRGSLNRGRYRNAEMDRLVELAEAEQDDARRWQIYCRIQELISKDFPYVSLWYKDNYAVIRSDLQGLELTLNGSFHVLYKLHYR